MSSSPSSTQLMTFVPKSLEEEEDTALSRNMEQLLVPVHVALSGLKGDTLSLTTHMDVNIMSLKRQVHDQWGIPLIFQKLVFDLGPYQSTSTITACLTLGMDDLREQIWRKPLLAVTNLVELPSAYHVPVEIFDLIGEVLHRSGKSESLELALTVLYLPLDGVVESALRFCRHARASIRYRALRALHWKLNDGTWSDALLEKGVAAAIESCHDADAWVRWASLCFFNDMASPRKEHSDMSPTRHCCIGNSLTSRMIAEALELCRDDDAYVRQAAVCTLSKVRDFEKSQAIMDALCAYAENERALL